ncbi:MAG TPA: DUF6062 family protein [Methylomirabilota bacterium]|nr:DUF6062 family protein [Methylomirabilota bacterium]
MDLDRLLGDLGWRSRGRPSKFIAYFHLLDACGKPRCPVCRCLHETTFRALDGLLYEQVTDPATRGILDRSWGFCAWHAWMSTEVGNAGLGIAIIYQDLLGRLRDRLNGTQRELRESPVLGVWRRLFGRRPSVGFLRARATRRRCPLCEMVGSAETGYLQTLLDHIQDPDFDRAYARSTGVCLPHLTLALARFPRHAGAVLLLGQALRRLDRLAEHLAGFIGKHDYRKHAPFTDEEAASWTNALDFVAGHPKLFGNEIPRSLTPAPTDQAPRTPGPPESNPTSAESADALRERLEALAFETGRLELRLRELTRPLGDESSRQPFTTGSGR